MRYEEKEAEEIFGMKICEHKKF